MAVDDLPRLELLRELLAEDGSIWVSIDDNEAHYLKVVMDEVFGRGCFVASSVCKKRYSRENREVIGDAHEYVLIYAKDVSGFKSLRNLYCRWAINNDVLYKNPDGDSRGIGRACRFWLKDMAKPDVRNRRTEWSYPFPPAGNCWKVVRPEYEKLVAENRVYFGKDGNGVPRRKEFLENAKGLVPWTSAARRCWSYR